MPDPVAGESQVIITAIFAVALTDLGQVVINILPGQRQKRADDSQSAFPAQRPHPFQRAGTAAAEKFEEDGLSLIVGVVTEGDGIDPGLFSEIVKKAVAEEPGGFFGGVTRPQRERADRTGFDPGGEIKSGGEFFDPFRVPPGGFPSQRVIEMNYRQLQRGTQESEEREKGYRIGTSRDGNHDPLTRPQKPVSAAVIIDFIPQPTFDRPRADIFILLILLHILIMDVRYSDYVKRQKLKGKS